MNIVSLEAVKGFVYAVPPAVGSFLGKTVTVITANPVGVAALVVAVALAAVAYKVISNRAAGQKPLPVVVQADENANKIAEAKAQLAKAREERDEKGINAAEEILKALGVPEDQYKEVAAQ